MEEPASTAHCLDHLGPILSQLKWDLLATLPLSGRVGLKKQHKKILMPVQINEDWHKRKGLADVWCFNGRTDLVTGLLLDLFKNLYFYSFFKFFRQVFPLQLKSAVSLAWIYGWKPKKVRTYFSSDPWLHFYIPCCYMVSINFCLIMTAFPVGSSVSTPSRHRANY